MENNKSDKVFVAKTEAELLVIVTVVYGSK